MSQPPPNGRGATRLARPFNFFFAAADPTTMAFLRIVVGSLVLYTHLAYSYDLTAFFGPNSWYGQDVMERERLTVPHFVSPPAWDDPFLPARAAQIPEAPHRRAAILAYMRGLLGPDSTPASAAARLAYLDRLQRIELDQIQRRVALGNVSYDGLKYASYLSPDPRDRADQLAVLVDEKLREAKAAGRVPPLPIPTPPAVANGMNLEQRQALAREVEAFVAALPADPDRSSIVLTFLGELDYGQRQAWVDFVKRLSKLDPAERDRQLDYFDYWNVDPAILLRAGTPVFSIWFHLTDPTLMKVAHGAMLVVFTMFTLGLFTRVTSVLTWLAVLCYIHRCTQVLFGMDTMMNIVVIYLMISDCGATLSLDRLLNRYRAARRSLRLTGTLDGPTLAYMHAPPLSVSTGFAQRLLQMHFCVIYMASGLSKLKGAAWWNTTAYWDTLVNPEFTMIYYQWYEDTVRAIVSSRPLFAAISAAGVAYTFVCELGLPFLVWTRARPWVVIMAIALHFGIGMFMGLIVFSLFMMAMLLSYLPGAAIRDRLFGPPGKPRVLKYPAGAAYQHRVAVLAAADFSDNLTAEALPEGATRIEVLEDGKPVPPSNKGWQAVIEALTYLPRRAGLMA